MKWLIILLLTAFSLSSTSCAVLTEPIDPSPEGKAVIRVARRLAFKKIRSVFKDQLEDQFRQDPSMSYTEFERRGNIIHNLGRRIFSDYEADRIRESVLDRTGVGVEKEELGKRRNRPLAEDGVDLVQWGRSL